MIQFLFSVYVKVNKINNTSRKRYFKVIYKLKRKKETKAVQNPVPFTFQIYIE